MATQPSSLPPLDVQRAPEGGEVGAVQSGWRLALREFASNRLAVIGFGILIFFVLFCFVGPLIYHGEPARHQPHRCRTCRPRAPAPARHRQPGLRRARPDHEGRPGRAGDRLLRRVRRHRDRHAVGRRVRPGRRGRRLDHDARRRRLPLHPVPVRGADPGGQVRRDRAVAEPGHRRSSPGRCRPGWSAARCSRCENATSSSAARTAGAGSWRLISRHLLPNALGVVIVNVTFQVADAILAVAYARLPRLRPALPERRLGRHALQRHHLPAGRLLVADLPGRRLHRPGRDGAATSSATRCATRWTSGSAAVSDRHARAA